MPFSHFIAEPWARQALSAILLMWSVPLGLRLSYRNVHGLLNDLRRDNVLGLDRRRAVARSVGHERRQADARRKASFSDV
jgi:hypothetical protein